MTIHVFGAGTGESILVETPDGWGMLDSFRWRGTIPSLEYLKQRECRRLLFLGLTHPHADHYAGLNKVIEHFAGLDGIANWWRYPCLEANYLFKLLRARLKQKQQEPFRSEQEEALGDLVEAYRLLLPLTRRDGPTRTHILSLGMRPLERETLTVVALTPCGDIVQEAETALVVPLKSNEDPEKIRSWWDLNRLSFTVDLRFGRTRVLLTGDTPSDSWVRSIEYESFPARSAICVYKASHHGNARDNAPSILARLSEKNSSSLAVCTRHAPSNLPGMEGLTILQDHFGTVHVLGQPNQRPARNPQGLTEEVDYPPQRISVSTDTEGNVVQIEGPVAA